MSANIMNNNIWVLLGVLSFWGCQDSAKKDIRDYYFPLKALEEGLVYEYEPVKMDSLTPTYWYYRSFISEESIFLTGTYYEYELIPLQYVREELVKNGMLLADIRLFEKIDSVRQQPVKVDILSGSVFPFEVSDSSGVFLYKIQWRPLADTTALITLIKNRHYAGDTLLTIAGKKHKALRFEVKELLSYDKDGVLEQQYSSTELYAKGLGLVYFDKKITDELQWAYQLKARYPMTELEEKFKQSIEAIE